TPLHWAAINAQLATCCYLIEPGAEVDAWAARNGHLYMIHLLISHNADPNFTDTQGYNALHLVTHSSSVMLLLYLLHQLVNVDSRDMQGLTSLMWAAYQGDALSVDLLLKHSANLNLKDNVSLLLLHWAVVRGNRAILRQLMLRVTLLELAVELKSFGAWKHSMEEGGMNEFSVKKVKPLNERNTRIAIFVLPALFLYIIFTTLSISPWYTGMVLAMAEFFALHHIIMRVLFNKDSYVETVNQSPYFVGIIAINHGELKAIIEDLASEGQLNGQTFCIQCMKPLCSKHCRMCDRCVARSDHHCPWIWNCVTGIILFDYLTYEFYASATAPDNIMADCSPIFCVPAAIDSFLLSMSLWSTLQLTWTLVLLLTQFWQVARQLTTPEVSNLGRYGSMGGCSGLVAGSGATGIQMGHCHHHVVNNDRGDEESEGEGEPKHRHHHVGLCKALSAPGTCGAFLLNLVGLDHFTCSHAAHGLALDFWTMGKEVGVDYGQVYDVPPEGFEEGERKRDAEWGEFKCDHDGGSRSKSLLAKLGLRMTTSSSWRGYEPLS
ncbi:palmitoyltransferase AKR1, partial [Pisolithus tinctorius]